MKAILTALALASLAVPAAAAPVQQSMTIKTSDLNLSSEEGQKTLALRVHRAAKTMCETEAMDQLPQNRRAERQCIEEAKSSAMAAVQRKSGVRTAGQ